MPEILQSGEIVESQGKINQEKKDSEDYSKKFTNEQKTLGKIKDLENKTKKDEGDPDHNLEKSLNNLSLAIVTEKGVDSQELKNYWGKIADTTKDAINSRDFIKSFNKGMKDDYSFSFGGDMNIDKFKNSQGDIKVISALGETTTGAALLLSQRAKISGWEHRKNFLTTIRLEKNGPKGIEYVYIRK